MLVLKTKIWLFVLRSPGGGERGWMEDACCDLVSRKEQSLPFLAKCFVALHFPAN